MNIQKIVALLFICVLLLSSCKKDKDIVSSQNIHGQVYNLCTDSGMANITVYLQENGSNITQINSDAKGNFNFNNAQIHSGSDYAYNIEVQSVDYIGGGTQPAIDGDNIEINKNNLNQSFVLNVVPHAKIWGLYFPSSINATIWSDTFTLVLQQKVYSKNVPNGVNTLTACICPYPMHQPPVNFIGNLDHYTMGWWYTTLDKTINGVHIIKKDSFYVGWWTNVTDTIPW